MCIYIYIYMYIYIYIYMSIPVTAIFVHQMFVLKLPGLDSERSNTEFVLKTSRGHPLIQDLSRLSIGISGILSSTTAESSETAACCGNILYPAPA